MCYNTVVNVIVNDSIFRLEDIIVAVWEIIGGILLILCSIVIIAVVMGQETKDQGLTSAIGGGYNESFFGKNMSRTKDAKLSRLTRNCAILMVIITIAMNIASQVVK